jgi:ankyrin repeat protein
MVPATGLRGATPHAASFHQEMVRLIVSHGSSVNRLDVHGHGPLWHAAQQGHGEIIQFLIQEGAVVSSIDQFLVREFPCTLL